MHKLNPFICSFIKFILAVIITGELFILAGYDTSKLNLRDFDAWSETRKKGKLNFTLVNGLLAWGLPMFIVMTFVVNEAFDESGLIISHVVINGVGWTIGGLLFGATTWFFTERKYHKEIAKRKET